MKGDGRGHAQHQERSHHDEHNGHHARHQHEEHRDTPHHGHGGHPGHHAPAIFKRRFFIGLALTIPILYFSVQLQEWLGYEAIAFPGSN